MDELHVCEGRSTRVYDRITFAFEPVCRVHEVRLSIKRERCSVSSRTLEDDQAMLGRCHAPGCVARWQAKTRRWDEKRATERGGKLNRTSVGRSSILVASSSSSWATERSSRCAATSRVPLATARQSLARLRNASALFSHKLERTDRAGSPDSCCALGRKQTLQIGSALGGKRTLGRRQIEAHIQPPVGPAKCDAA